MFGFINELIDSKFLLCVGFWNSSSASIELRVSTFLLAELNRNKQPFTELSTSDQCSFAAIKFTDLDAEGNRSTKKVPTGLYRSHLAALQVQLILYRSTARDQ